MNATLWVLVVVITGLSILAGYGMWMNATNAPGDCCRRCRLAAGSPESPQP